MNAALVLGLLLAQAQPAPDAQPAPTLTAPAATPASAPSAPPPTPVAPTTPEPAEPSNAISVFAGLSYRVSPGGEQLSPSAGFSLSGAYERRYASLGAPPHAGTLELGFALSFFHDHFSLGLQLPSADDRVLTQTGFTVAQTVALPLPPVSLWAAVGAGFTVAYFSSPEPDLRPGSASARQPLLTGGAGVDWTIQKNTGLRLRLNFTHTLTRPGFVTEMGSHLDLFGDLLDIGAGLFYRF
ncbi:MAG: hypothetical protein QOI66_1169 [Myxococcales bacterium]|jgi:hypothetical protein|nr:hypothetical protein [Myxococcales bacterium]